MLSGIQCRMARGALGWSVQELANNSGVSVTTIKRIETQDSVLDGAQVRTLQAIVKAFTSTGKIRFEGLNGVFAEGI
jgi:transcriptional regulator with XRE-family HTH domain